MTTPTTRVNPGAFNPMPAFTYKRVLKGVASKILKGEFNDSLNFTISGFANLLHQSRKKPRFFCNICLKQSSYFIHISNPWRIKWNSACPNCNSRPRHRGLMEMYRQFEPGGRILHFAPEPIFYSLFKNHTWEYLTSDHVLSDVDLPGQDIQKLDIPENSFNIILCNHVIEHVPDDDRALQEINRILKKGGRALITIPGDFRRQNTVCFPDLRYNGHYRDYGKDFHEKVQKFFQTVEVIDLNSMNSRYDLPLGIAPESDVVFICWK